MEVRCTEFLVDTHTIGYHWVTKLREPLVRVSQLECFAFFLSGYMTGVTSVCRLCM